MLQSDRYPIACVLDFVWRMIYRTTTLVLSEVGLLIVTRFQLKEQSRLLSMTTRDLSPTKDFIGSTRSQSTRYARLLLLNPRREQAILASQCLQFFLQNVYRIGLSGGKYIPQLL